LPKVSYGKPSRGLFGVDIRRGGKFFNIGTGSLPKVQRIGQERVSRTLSATFRIRGGSIPGLRTPKGFYSKSTDEGTLFIEKRGRRLKRGSGEVEEILTAKARKKKSKRKKK